MKIIQKKSGFTMIEVMLAMLILSVALLGVARISVSVVRGNAFSSNFTTATALAQEKLEKLSNLAFDDASLNDANAENNSTAGLLSSATTDFQETQVDVNGVASMPGGIFTRTWNVWDRTDLSNPATRKDIAVIVSWQDVQGNPKTATISTTRVN